MKAIEYLKTKRLARALALRRRTAAKYSVFHVTSPPERSEIPIDKPELFQDEMAIHL